MECLLFLIRGNFSPRVNPPLSLLFYQKGLKSLTVIITLTFLVEIVKEVIEILSQNGCTPLICSILWFNPIHTGPFGGSSVPGGGGGVVIQPPPPHNFWLGIARLTKLTTMEAHNVRHMLIRKKNWWRHVFGDDVIIFSQNAGFLGKNHYMFKSPSKKLQKSFFDSVFAQMRTSDVTFTGFQVFC